MSWLAELTDLLDNLGAHVATGGILAAFVVHLSAEWWVAAKAFSKTTRRSRGRSFLLDLLLPIKIARDAQANLEEVMPVWARAHGRRRAALIRFVQVLLIIGGHWLHPVVRFFERILKIVRGRSAD